MMSSITNIKNAPDGKPVSDGTKSHVTEEHQVTQEPKIAIDSKADSVSLVVTEPVSDETKPHITGEQLSEPKITVDSKAEESISSVSTELAEQNETKQKEDVEGDGVISLAEALEEQDRLEKDAEAVLGASDPTVCSYAKGYVHRQALYSCLTCQQSVGGVAEPAGVCLACSLECHEGHDLVELYTKRDFRCDCGNSRFPADFVCRLCPDKDSANTENKYGQNFHGKYCTCARPYPDPEDTTGDEMIQCVVCEDWFHTRHLNKRPDIETPSTTDFSEMICHLCVEKFPFLNAYNQLWNKVAESASVQSVPLTEKTTSLKCKKPSVETTQQDSLSPAFALFWSDGWRKSLCECNDCLDMYHDKICTFLIEEKDPVIVYENEAADRAKCGDEMQALSQLDRVQQVEVLTEYNSLRSELSEFLAGFAESGRVVQESDIGEFFAALRAKKRPRLDLSDSCR